MKLQSTIDRGASKEGTDLLDALRLTIDPIAGSRVRAQLARTDERLRRAALWHVDWCFQQHANRSLARIRRIPQGADTEADDLALAHELLTQALSG